jgi:integrase
MPRLKLSARFIETIKPIPGRRLEFQDTLVPQLMLRVGTGGKKSWALLARYPGYANPTRRTLGPVFAGDRPPALDLDVYERDGAALTLSEAREKARRWLDLVSRKIDPAELRKERAAAAAQETQATALAERSTFGAVAEEWIRRHGGELAKAVEAERLVRREFVARWQRRPITSIAPKEAAAAIRAIVDRHAGTTATGRPAGTFQAFAAFGYLRQIYNFAIGSGEFDITASPLAGLRQKDMLGEKTSRDRVLEDTELRAVWAAAVELGYPWGDAVRLLILTGQRLREIADLNWSEIDLEQQLITIPARRMKGSRAHEIPLAPITLALLQTLPQWTEGCRFALSASGGKRPLAGFGRTKRRLDEISQVRDWVLHDLRRTMRTGLSALPIEDRVREAMIAHAAPGLHQVYDQHRYVAEKRRGFELWEARLAQILAPERKVVPLRGGR